MDKVYKGPPQAGEFATPAVAPGHLHMGQIRENSRLLQSKPRPETHGSALQRNADRPEVVTLAGIVKDSDSQLLHQLMHV